MQIIVAMLWYVGQWNNDLSTASKLCYSQITITRKYIKIIPNGGKQLPLETRIQNGDNFVSAIY